MAIKMIVDECDQYELQDITDTFSLIFLLQTSGSDPKLFLGEVGEA